MPAPLRSESRLALRLRLHPRCAQLEMHHHSTELSTPGKLDEDAADVAIALIPVSSNSMVLVLRYQRGRESSAKDSTQRQGHGP